MTDAMEPGNGGPIRPGDKAPAIRLPRLGGGEARVPPPEGRALLLVVFKHDCPTCRLALPLIERLHRGMQAVGERVFGVSQDGPEETARLAEELDLTMPVLIDAPDLAASRAYDPATVPALYLIDDTGTILRSMSGFDRKELERMAARLASGAGTRAPALWSADESIPEFKPG